MLDCGSRDFEKLSLFDSVIILDVAQLFEKEIFCTKELIENLST